MIASAAACSVAILHGAPNLDDVAKSAASTSLATQRVLHADAANNERNRNNVDPKDDENSKDGDRKHRRVN